MTDQIFFSGLALHAYHGVMPHEAKVGQTFKLDMTLDIDLKSASRSDKLADTDHFVAMIAVGNQIYVFAERIEDGKIVRRETANAA